MSAIRILDEDGTFSIDQPENTSYLYFPLAGEAGLKSSITPNLGGDSKIDQESFLLEPVSAENLHNNRSTRNFWCTIKGRGSWSAAGSSAEAEGQRFTAEQDESAITAGFMWQRMERASRAYGLEAKITSFVPVGDNVEVMHVVIRNIADTPQEVAATAAVPIYGRSADNIRDHRNVTSMLHRIRVGEYGVFVKPTMSFDEKGHRENHKIYYVMGMTGDGEKPELFFPTTESFIGEGGTFTRPAAIFAGTSAQGAGVPCGEGASPKGEPLWVRGAHPGDEFAGREAVGAMRFAPTVLAAGEEAQFIILMGITESEEEIEKVRESYGTSELSLSALSRTREYWQKKVNVRFDTGRLERDAFLRWVSFQPSLRRLFGCSFLPHHDYGRGGRGWRDLWQDCLSLLLMDPDGVRGMLLGNFGGVRVDGTNATIIGHGQGEFVADRNGIARVWMDHAMWPFLTMRLYIDQTGDFSILGEKAAYFKDSQAKRGTGTDDAWDDAYGMRQRMASGEVYMGTVLEHMLIENLAAFYEVGGHNEIRLRGADWNDALDMAEERGESVAFTCAYAGNLRQLSELVLSMRDKCGTDKIAILKEAAALLSDDESLFDSVEQKNQRLAEYLESCYHDVSGETVLLDAMELAATLRHMSDWMMRHIRGQEWIGDEGGEGWFNSYYDNHGQAVEGIRDDGVRMMLTGQVFAIMSGTATDSQVGAICRSADHYLYDAAAGGYRLNTDFHELKFDMGRMFGFAYGEKENGAVFSHMAVMYANALYKRGFVREGNKALKSLMDTALDFETSRIYPGIPEYFNADGRGMYHYLTGAASWYMMTVMTEAFGARGEDGDLCLRPRLLLEQFDGDRVARIRFPFAGRTIQVAYYNEDGADYGEYRVAGATIDGTSGFAADGEGTSVLIPRSVIEGLGEGVMHHIEVRLKRA